MNWLWFGFVEIILNFNIYSIFVGTPKLFDLYNQVYYFIFIYYFNMKNMDTKIKSFDHDYNLYIFKIQIVCPKNT